MQDQIDIAHISAGSFANDTMHICIPTAFLPEGCNAYLARTVKACPDIHIPVLTLGAFQEPQAIENILASGGADIVAMARGTIADAHLVNKAYEGREDEIIPCIRCLRCLNYDRPPTCTFFGCSVNPAIGKEHLLSGLIAPKAKAKKIVVVGGGPAGMEASIIAAKRGHQVTLLEQSGELGGKLTFSRLVPFKHDLQRFMDYLIRMVKKHNIDARFNTTATTELISALEPDVVISAIGAQVAVPPIEGINGANVISAVQCYKMIEAGEDIGDRVVVLGGGPIGCETAVFLAEALEKQVTLLEMRSELASEELYLPRLALLEHLNKSVTYHTNSRCTKIGKQGLIFMDKDNKEHEIEAQTIILATGMKPCSDESEAFREGSYIFIPVGDCVNAQNVQHAMRTAFDAVMHL
jgi:NADPH-dependent 2,4-dienoyl-CoA reductase/sulfur reductase-like enzyme